MRAGSGAVLLVGFALVIILLSTAEVIEPLSIGMKQDPSQDFADFASSINEIVHSYNSLRGNHEEKSTYIINSLSALSRQYLIKGINSTALFYIFGSEGSKIWFEIWIITPNGPEKKFEYEVNLNGKANYYDYGVSYILYRLASMDNTTYIQGNAFLPPPLGEEGQNKGKGSPGSLSSLIIIPPALCFREGQQESSTHFLIGNPNPVRINITLKYIGDDKIEELHVSFPGQGNGTVKDDDHDGELEFYLDPMTEPKGKGVALGQRTVGDAFINIKHNTTGQSSKLLVIVPEYNFAQDIPIYWNECPVAPWGQILKSLKTIGGVPAPKGG